MKKGQAGFTLLETLLTLSIMTLMLGIVFSALRLGVRAWEKGEVIAENASVKRYLVSRLVREVGSMYPYTTKEGYLLRGTSKSLGFVTTCGTGEGVPWGGAKWVYYSLGDGGLTVREKILPDTNAMENVGGRVVELGPDVSDISFEYMGDEGWGDTWDTNAKKGTPRALRAKFEFKDRRVFAVTVPIGIDTGSDIRPSKGSG